MEVKTCVSMATSFSFHHIDILLIFAKIIIEVDRWKLRACICMATSFLILKNESTHQYLRSKVNSC